MKSVYQSFLAILITTLLKIATADSTFSPARPPAIPLAVKSPYFNTWLFSGSNAGNGGYLAGQWPQFWAGQVTAWTGLIRVDGIVYTWMGAPSGPAVVIQTGFEYTSTRSTFTVEVGGKVEMNITFLSPVTPNDMKRQSLVFSYLDVSVQSLDGVAHSIQIYADISAEWVAGDHSSVAQWDYGLTTDNIAYHKVYRQQQKIFSETNQQADWGTWYWATLQTPGLSYQSGADTVVRGAFEANGALPNTKDTNFRSINQEWPVFGFSSDLGSVTNPVNTLYTLGLTQQQAIQFDGATGIVPLTSLWPSYFPSEVDALNFFYNDYDAVGEITSSFDHSVSTDSVAAGGQDYLIITSLSVRQAFGALQLVGNSTKPYLFLKEISSDGNVQTVDVIFPFHPVLLYANPSLLKLLLDPLFENQETGKYPNKYSMHDLGASYPNGTGHPDGRDEPQPLEECGNMLIMALAYAQRTNDVAYLIEHYSILDQWTQYLIDEALIPADQISTDDFAGSLVNQTNLALKGIIGIEAMAQIAKLTGNDVAANNYTTISHAYVDQWQILGIAHDANPPHTTLSYGQNESHGLLYNLYGDALLNLDLIPRSVYDMQSTFYSSVLYDFGIPLDTRHNYTKSDWEMFAAAVASESTKNKMIHCLANWINKTPTHLPLTDLYDTQTGNFPPGLQFASRPVVGGHFALLALPHAAWAR